MSTQEPPPKQPAKTPAFPSITGSCVCNTVRYRLLTSPLYCYACHCRDCQKQTGSAFGLLLSIETYNLQIISPTPPVRVTQTKKSGRVSRTVQCPQCHVQLWSNNAIGASIADVRVGTLDYPGLMEPDAHGFIESKVDWVVLPEGARTIAGEFKFRELWPKSSLKRLDVCLAWAAEAAKKRVEEARARGMDGDGGADDGAGDGEKTPTAVEFGGEVEDDEAFERRFQEAERALQERLAKLSKKLEEGDSRKQGGLEELTSKLQIADDQPKKAA
ncbi:Mss4-like protein [Phaeosphaeriaceae sp. PMI808]|nr:Mss4-like protein [Phaeosphaeriaceae sp. PMI808]